MIRLVALALFGMTGCTTQDAPYVTVAQFVQGVRPAPHKGDPKVPGLTPAAVLLRATVTEVRTAPTLLVELSDPQREEHMWVTGFSQPPGRGQEIWTGIVGPSTPHDLVVSTYPSTGLLAAPKGRSRVTPRGALGLLVGGAALAAILACGLAMLATGRSRSRRCPGCAGPVNPRWLTCPRCGHTLTAPPVTPAPLIPASGRGPRDERPE